MNKKVKGTDAQWFLALNIAQTEKRIDKLVKMLGPGEIIAQQQAALREKEAQLDHDGHAMLSAARKYAEDEEKQESFIEATGIDLIKDTIMASSWAYTERVNEDDPAEMERQAERFDQLCHMKTPELVSEIQRSIERADIDDVMWIILELHARVDEALLRSKSQGVSYSKNVARLILKKCQLASGDMSLQQLQKELKEMDQQAGARLMESLIDAIRKGDRSTAFNVLARLFLDAVHLVSLSSELKRPELAGQSE